MSQKIKILDRLVAEKIAAGEVVEKPSSVVKELVENSIDAGATRIDVEIRDGGRNRIKITDNGCGMSPDDAIVAFERHSTSKIREFEDIYEIVSMGFRGEALASISAVSEVELVTREKDKVLGTKVVFHGGKFIEEEEAGCPEGTTILVEKLFYNVPARRKFLSSSMSEQSAINKVLMRMALSHPEIFFTFSNEKKQIFSYPPVENLVYRVGQIYGKDTEDRLLEVENTVDDITLSGLVSHPSLAFANRSRIFVFVNKRFVRSSLLYKAIQDPFQKLIPARKFPVAILFIEISPAMIDINIHPTKEDIKFAKQSLIFPLIMKGIKNALHRTETTSISFQKKIKKSLAYSGEYKGEQALPGFSEEKPSFNLAETILPKITKENLLRQMKEEKSSYIPESLEETGAIQSFGSTLSLPEISGEYEAGPVQHAEDISSEILEKINTEAEEEKVLPPSSLKTLPSEEDAEKIGKERIFSDATVIGNFKNTYIIAKTAGELLLIDQHIAHERINFEMLHKNLKSESAPSQALLLPLTMDFSSHEAHWLKENLSLFSEVGFDLEHFGGNTFLLRGIPAGLDRLKEEKFFREIICEAVLSERKFSSRELFTDILAEIACKASVKAGDKLSTADMDKLVKNLFKTREPYYCPHGRPVILSYTMSDLAKLFKRA